jgi:hypothetical protein
MPRTVRPPNEKTNEILNKMIYKNKMKIILTTLNCNNKNEKNSQIIYEKIIKKVNLGDILTLQSSFHKQTLEILPMLIDYLYKNGYEFLTIAEMLSYPDDSPH